VKISDIRKVLMQADYESGAAAQKRIDEAGSQGQDVILVELVNNHGATTGVLEKIAAHKDPGHLHRAFSVFLFDEADRLLLQRRALTKYHSPGVWSNSCCGHPYPHEFPFLAAARRTAAELGAPPAELREAGITQYHHRDAITGLVEQEYNHLFVGLVRQPLTPDPDEVSAITFSTPSELRRLRNSDPFSSWFETVFRAAQPTIRAVTGAGNW
jgi:isopentenyl-diphosphate Delta-isomerase